jgi:hypothetical protein
MLQFRLAYVMQSTAWLWMFRQIPIDFFKANCAGQSSTRIINLPAFCTTQSGSIPPPPAQRRSMKMSLVYILFECFYGRVKFFSLRGVVCTVDLTEQNCVGCVHVSLILPLKCSPFENCQIFKHTLQPLGRQPPVKNLSPCADCKYYSSSS